MKIKQCHERANKFLENQLAQRLPMKTFETNLMEEV